MTHQSAVSLPRRARRVIRDMAMGELQPEADRLASEALGMVQRGSGSEASRYLVLAALHRDELAQRTVHGDADAEECAA